jgi:hypothetical protein
MLLVTLPPFPMWPAFPASEYCGGSATTRRQQRASRLPVHRLAAGRRGRRRVASHVHWSSFRRGRCPASPRRYRPNRTSQSWLGPLAAHRMDATREGGRSVGAPPSTAERPIHQGLQVVDDSRGLDH